MASVFGHFWSFFRPRLVTRAADFRFLFGVPFAKLSNIAYSEHSLAIDTATRFKVHWTMAVLADLR